jgi:hypothetical protein
MQKEVAPSRHSQSNEIKAQGAAGQVRPYPWPGRPRSRARGGGRRAVPAGGRDDVRYARRHGRVRGQRVLQRSWHAKPRHGGYHDQTVPLMSGTPRASLGYSKLRTSPHILEVTILAIASLASAHVCAAVYDHSHCVLHALKLCFVHRYLNDGRIALCYAVKACGLQACVLHIAFTDAQVLDPCA